MDQNHYPVVSYILTVLMNRKETLTREMENMGYLLKQIDPISHRMTENGFLTILVLDIILPLHGG